MDIESYLSGYADSEGCFCITINKSKRHKFGWELRPSFSVSQNHDRAEILELYQKVFKCGSIRPDRSDKTLKYEVRSIVDLMNKIIPHFEKYPLLSSKKNDFVEFAKVCEIMKDKKHLTRDGFNQVMTLAKQVNISGKKKYIRELIKI